MENIKLGDDLAHEFLVDEHYVVHTDDALDQEENSSDGGGRHMPLREQDRFLPIANIAKIMKRAIPDNGKIAKDARECLQECISEFISFITSEASDRCQVEKRKTINGEDVLFAMNTLGFDNYLEPLKAYLTKYRELVLSPVCFVTFMFLALHVTMTVNKVNKIVFFEEAQENSESNPEPTETEGDDKITGTVLYAYPKVIGDFNIV